MTLRFIAMAACAPGSITPSRDRTPVRSFWNATDETVLQHNDQLASSAIKIRASSRPVTLDRFRAFVAVRDACRVTEVEKFSFGKSHVTPDHGEPADAESKPQAVSLFGADRSFSESGGGRIGAAS